MGMIFVPLFGIIMGDIADHEVGSASGILEALQQLGATLGIAVLGTVFFGAWAHTGGSALSAATTVALITIALTVVGFVLAFALPAKSRMTHV